MNPSVLVFDSGVGGLSVLQQIRKRSPGLTLNYLMDSAAFPYGIKRDEVLVKRVLDVCQAAVDELSPGVLVIACNTASTLALPALREVLNIPVVGVVPAIKTAASHCSSGHIGLLATPATVNRSYTDDLIRDFAGHCQVSRFGSSELVRWAEEWLLNDEPSAQRQAQLREHLKSWIEHNSNTVPTMSHVVLGCTHFPLLREQLEQLWPHIHWVDSGEAIARRVASLLPGSEELSSKGALNCYWTDRHQVPQGAINYLSALSDVINQGCLGPDFVIQDIESV